MLQGDGRLRGNVQVAGLMSPGESIGLFTVEGNCQLAGITIMEIAANDSIRTNDQLACTGTLALGGKLVVTNAGITPFALGDSFKLLTAGSLTGGFDSIELPLLPSELNWDASHLNSDGILSIVPGAGLPRPTLSVVLDATNLTLSWPEAYGDFILQGQTNSLDSGFSPGWYPVEGVTNHSVSLPVDPTLGSAIFRLVKP